MANEMVDFSIYNQEIVNGNFRSDYRVNFNTPSESNYLSNEAFKMLRTNLFFCGVKYKTVLVTSCLENDGKSTISIELAKSLAEFGKKTLLIDADMRKSVLLRKRQNGTELKGLSEVLSGQVSPKEVVLRTQNDNFDVIFSGQFPPNPVELIGNGVIEKLLNALKQYYDYIIIDSPPLGMVIDAAVLASICDGAIMVINNGKISRGMAMDVKQQLVKSGCKILGAVLNNTDKKRKYRAKYGYKNDKYGYKYRQSK